MLYENYHSKVIESILPVCYLIGEKTQETHETQENLPTLQPTPPNPPPSETTTPQIGLMERLGELYREVGGRDLTPEGFLSVAISRLSTENEDRLREVISHLANRVPFRISKNDKPGGNKT